MFRAITQLLFGGEEQTKDDFKSGELPEEEWQVVSHQEASFAENQGPEQTAADESSPAQHQDAIGLVDPEPAAQSSTTRPAVAGVAAQPKPSSAVEQLSQKTRTWAHRQHVTRNSLQRHNRLRQGIQQCLFHLQQPGRRSLAH